VTLARIALGKFGEELACQELERRGYVILARRYRQRGGELDIIAQDGQAIVFVEVKAREGHDYGEAVEAVTSRKRRRMTQLARLSRAEQSDGMPVPVRCGVDTHGERTTRPRGVSERVRCRVLISDF